MQRVLEEQPTRHSIRVEIQTKWAQPPAFVADLQRIPVDLIESSRLIDVECGSASVPVDLLLSHLGVLLDPLTEHAVTAVPDGASLCLDVFCRPGVTDSEGAYAARTLALVAPALDDIQCCAGTRYRFSLPVPHDVRARIERMAGNPLIHRFCWSDDARSHGNSVGRHDDSETWTGAGDRAAGTAGTIVRYAELPHFDDVALLQLSRDLGLALDVAEMRAIAEHFRGLGRPPTDVELQSLAQTWSEHCSHKTFKATIDMLDDGRQETIHGLLATYLAAPTAALDRPWVRSAFTDNAGIIAFDDQHDVAFKVETHNHPSALEPFGGAHTGIGGVIRDVLAVSAEPIANTDVLCFGPLDLPVSAVLGSAWHPVTTYREVVRGIADYGNNMGIPTIGGAILFHPGYVANPLVFCGTIGIAPRCKHPTRPQPGDTVLVLGGRTGRDGLHGATMSSALLDRSTVESTVVQIGNPIIEKTVRDVLPLLRDEGLYHAITDCGAGGLCSAVGEMGEKLGVEVNLERVPLKYPGLLPWEIWLSEAQERMVLAVPPQALPRVFELCDSWDVEAAAIGHFRDDGHLVIRHHDAIAAHLDMAFLHGGRPPRRLSARWDLPASAAYEAGRVDDANEWVLRLLSHPSIASKEEVIRQYDHEVGGATVLKPLVGDTGLSDAAALKPLPNSWGGVVVAHGINPLYGSLDPHAMAMLAVDEALRNVVTAGGRTDHTALLDNFCWGNVADPAELGSLVRAVRGCRDAALAYGVPFISGKDSLYNSSTQDGRVTSIPGTLLISALSVIPDVRATVSGDLKQAGNVLYLLGTTADELGGSHYLSTRALDGGRAPQVRPEETLQIMRGLSAAIESGVVRSCHDLSEGGLAVAAAEMAIAGNLGMTLQIELMPVAAHADLPAEEALLFAESAGRFLVEVAPQEAESFELLFGGSPIAAIGDVTDQPHLVVRSGQRTLVNIPVRDAAAAWRRI